MASGSALETVSTAKPQASTSAALRAPVTKKIS
jgi:hypothetical protein